MNKSKRKSKGIKRELNGIKRISKRNRKEITVNRNQKDTARTLKGHQKEHKRNQRDISTIQKKSKRNQKCTELGHWAIYRPQTLFYSFLK